MHSMIAKFSTIVLVASAISSCASGPFNSEQHALTVAEAHPISVDSQVITMTIDVDPSTADISNLDRARLRAMANSYLQSGHGQLTVTAPSGGGADFDGQEAASDVRKALNEFGVPWSSIAGATYRTGAPAGENQLVISYTHYVATASPCGVWRGLKVNDYRNLRSPNFGCANQNNIAALVADPRDLIAPSAVGDRDAVFAVRGVEAYRAGEVTASEIDEAIDTQISN